MAPIPGVADLADALVFYAPFDQTPNARVANGRALAYTSATLERKHLTAGLPATTKCVVIRIVKLITVYAACVGTLEYIFVYLM